MIFPPQILFRKPIVGAVLALILIELYIIYKIAPSNVRVVFWHSLNDKWAQAIDFLPLTIVAPLSPVYIWKSQRDSIPNGCWIFVPVPSLTVHPLSPYKQNAKGQWPFSWHMHVGFVLPECFIYILIDMTKGWMMNGSWQHKEIFLGQ